MADYTGFNPNQAETDLSYLKRSLWEGINALNAAFNIIIDELSDVWASPKAVEFGSEYIQRLDNTQRRFVDDVNDILRNANNAVSIMATANGSNFHADMDNGFVAMDYLNKYKEEKDGIVGMNMIKAQEYQNAFKEKIKAFNNRLDELTFQEIALYDPEGAQREAFTNMILSFKNKLSEEVDAINSAISTAMLTETNNIRIAKEQAVSTLN